MPTLRIYCLGAFQATLDNKPLNFDTDKTRALLAYLALEAAQPQHRQRLAGLLWSDAPEESALHNLRQALSGLRKALHDESNTIPFLLIQRETIQINPHSNIWLDVTAFKENIASALRHYQHHPTPANVSRRLNLHRLEQAVTLFRGPFLDQMYLHGSPLFDEWASLEREVSNQRMIEALAILAELYERRGEMTQARQFASRIVALIPWDEPAQVQVMRLLAIEGQWSTAQAQFHHLRRYLQEQMGIEPAAETLALFELIRCNAAQNIPLPARQPLARNNLPTFTTPFIGRKSELDHLSTTLADPCCRLLTLIGPGGVGKTRLAIEAARQQVGIFGDGVYFLPLAALSSEDLLPAALAECLGMTFYGDETVSDQLLHFIRGKQMLWLLDNLEQLLPLSQNSLILQVLQQSPSIAILATSRQRLNVQEEILFPVAGLPYPAQQDSPNLASLESVQLFTNRAQRVMPHFNSDDEAVRQAIASICQLLEGLPLGIELAAATLWSHSPAEIAADLGQSLRSLAATSVNAVGRHRSLWAAIDVSWTLLSPEEQATLTQISVFRGGFSSEMAQQALGISPGLLASLLDKSLLRRDPTGRHDLHEAIRQFAAEKLAHDAAQASRAHTQHACFFAGFLSARARLLKSAGQLQALVEITLEWENVRCAWDWLSSQHHTDELARCLEAVFHYCNIRTRYHEGISLFTQAIACLNDDPLAQARALTFQGALAYRVLDNERCERCINLSLARYKSLDAPEDQALCLVFASGMAFRRKDPAGAMNFCKQALALFKQTGDAWGQAYAHYQLGLLESRAGYALESRANMQASLQAARTAGDLRRQIGPLNMLGDLACQSGDYAEARTYFEESLAISRTLEDRYNMSTTLNNLGTTFHYTCHYGQAKTCYEESLTISRGIGDQGGQSLALSNLGELALAQQQFAEAQAYFQQSLVLAREAGDEWAELIAWINLADAALGLGDQTATRQALSQAFPRAAQSGEPALVLRTLLHQGRLFLQEGLTQKGIERLGLVFHHEATYVEHRQAAQQVLEQAGLLLPKAAPLTIEAALEDALGAEGNRLPA